MPKKKPTKPVKVVKENKKGDVVSSLLDMVDGDDSSDDTEGEVQEVQEEPTKEPEQPPQPSLDYVLEDPGQPDGPLTYGIKFIQNALRSWAQQRLTHSMGPELHRQAHEWAQQQAAAKKRGPGRPRKFTGGEDEQQQPEPPNHPPPVLIKADTTPEGQAVKSFQEVIDSGCLQVNAVLPVELTEALRHLYMQIDQLINQGSKKEEKWACMSYGAQIAAHRTRVEKAKEAHAKAQEEIARQNQISHQLVLQQMGLPPTPSGPVNPNEATRQHELQLERRRSQQHAQQQPYLKQHHLNPLLLGSQPPGTPAGFAPSQSPANAPGPRSGSQAPTPVSASATPQGPTNQPSPINGQNPQHMEKVKMYMPGYMPRSGTQMKFSFTPADPNALQTFGQQAFAGPQMPSTGHRGPARGSHPPPSTSNAAQSPAGTPVVRSIETPVQVPQAHGSSDVIEISEKEAQGGDRDTDVEMVDAVPIKKEAGQTPAPAPPAPSISGFTAVNAPQQPIVINTSSPVRTNGPAGSPVLGSSAATVSKMKPQQNGGDMASRYPHPGAVVVDQ
ncbi:hypothetical protein Tdes44962_MAKER07567 [Teratosphaeria destructans]|uniref:Uncharacterized protein n=1 Tax=Teratosphaeria destructans TaxID=418781 RepID=A0A9W7W5M7_9PEZI|nr:hypothetical protein Tdes44962_MAKER07567 [Teratosphaeria destructans]